MTDKNIWIRNRTLEITRGKTDYMINDRKVDIIIHIARLDFEATTPSAWAYLFSKTDDYVGCIWIETQRDVDTLNKFLGETK